MPRLVLVEARVRVLPRHAHVHARLALDVTRVALAELAFLQHIRVQLDHVDIVVGRAWAFRQRPGFMRQRRRRIDILTASVGRT